MARNLDVTRSRVTEPCRVARRRAVLPMVLLAAATACSDGQSAPSRGAALALKNGGDSVYWLYELPNDVKQLMRAPKAGGAGQSILQAPGASDFAVGNGELFWFHDEEDKSLYALSKVSIADGTVTDFPEKMANLVGSTPVVLGADVYWLESEAGTSQSLVRTSTSLAEPKTAVAQVGLESDGLVTDGTKLYWADPFQESIVSFTPGSASPTPGTLARTGPGGEFGMLAAADGRVIAVSQTADSNGHTGTATLVEATASAPPQVLAESENGALAYTALVGATAYWLDYSQVPGRPSTGAIRKLPLDGGSPVDVAPLAQGFVVDDAATYWVTQTEQGGVLERGPK